MKRRMGMVRFVAATAFLVLFTAFLCVETVKCKTDIQAQEKELFYRALEEQLLEETRELLASEGFENSGIMLTRVVDIDGSRQYTMTVHHGRIDGLCEGERTLLLEKLKALAFQDSDCSFYHEFLINQ